jgi:hemin uptake protein HemP
MTAEAKNVEVFVVDLKGKAASLPMPRDEYLETLREFIDFVNAQVGVYMDALAGFAGNKARIEFQVARVLRPSLPRKDGDGVNVTVWSSFEDPGSPKVIHNRIVRASDYIAYNSVHGFNEQQHARAILVMIYSFWNDEIRPRLARCKNVKSDDVKVDALGDLRLLRHAILHNKGILAASQLARLKAIKELFEPDKEIILSHDGMHKLFVALKQGIATLIIEHAGPRPGTPEISQLVDVAIQRKA